MQAKWKRWVRTAERGDPERWGGRKAFLTKSERLHTHTARAHTHRNMHAILSRFRKSCFI